MVNSRLRLLIVAPPPEKEEEEGGIESGKGEGGGWKPPSLPPFAHTLLVR